MPAVGRPPKPIEQKRRLGNPGQRPLPKPSSLVAIEPADVAAIAAEMGPAGRALLDAGAGAWLARTDQVGLLRLIDNGWTEYEALRLRWVASDYSNETISRRLAKVEENLTKWLSLAGLTPVDRSRLGVAEVKVASTLETLAAKRATGRRAS